MKCVVQTYQSIHGAKNPSIGFFYIDEDYNNGGWVGVFYHNLKDKSKKLKGYYNPDKLGRSFKKDKIRSFDGAYFHVDKQDIQEYLSEYFNENKDKDIKFFLNLSIKKWQEADSTNKGIISILKRMVKEKKAERRKKMRLAKNKKKNR